MLRIQFLGLTVVALALATPALADSPTRHQEAQAISRIQAAPPMPTCGSVPLSASDQARLNDSPQGSRSLAARHSAVPCSVRPSHHGYADGTSFTRVSPAPYW
jgi:hypothetical protein